ncbi:MAG: sigma-70 family RNA polymerase sigma factor [Anaerolineae bacterium]|nr:sigma-70 family RNA polymerase sigma factor [Anaerolineae bacterium]
MTTIELDQALSVAQLTQRCAEEMARYQRRERHDPRCCYELFRRALVQRDDEAWTAIYGQYHRLVNHWLGHVPSDVDALVNQVFVRFWSALSPDRFSDFPSLDAILAYLKRCAQGVAFDARRREERRWAREAALFQVQQVTAAGEMISSTTLALDEIISEQLYEYVMERLNGTQESIAFRASFEWGLGPAEIAERWADVFSCAREVSRVKERILRRLRRDEGLVELLGMRNADGLESA